MSAIAAAPPTLIVPERLFRMGTIDLPDPAPTLGPLQALRLYVNQYPHLKRATLADPRVEVVQVIYEVEKPPVQTKGSA